MCDDASRVVEEADGSKDSLNENIRCLIFIAPIGITDVGFESWYKHDPLVNHQKHMTKDTD